MNMEDCPKFLKCSANICPIDPHWSCRAHIQGEQVCFYLRECVKVGGEARLRAYIPEEMLNQVVYLLPEIKSRYADLSARLERAKISGSKIESLNKAREGVMK